MPFRPVLPGRAEFPILYSDLRHMIAALLADHRMASFSPALFGRTVSVRLVLGGARAGAPVTRPWNGVRMKHRTKEPPPRQKPATTSHTVPTCASAWPGKPVLARAVTLHQQGKLRDAEALYREVLAETPEHVDALHLLGVLKAQSKRQLKRST